MLSRRLYSSLPSRLQSPSAPKPHSTSSSASSSSSSSSPATTRGRSKPLGLTSITHRIATSKQSRSGPVSSPPTSTTPSPPAAADKPRTGGRRKPSLRLSSIHPRAPPNFIPHYTTPATLALHRTFTLPHHPLPLKLGPGLYTSPLLSEILAKKDPFTLRPLADARSDVGVSSVDESGLRTGWEEHLEVVHRGGSISTRWISSGRGEGGRDGMSVLDEAGLRHRLKAEEGWEAVLRKMGEGGGTGVSAEEEGRRLGEVVGAVEGLDRLLQRLDVRVGEERVRMDSVKRKRKRKISKHKYKKRRKATRALRKKLGK